MSGGSLDYVYYRVENAASTLSGSGDPIHRAFAKHLKLVAKALKDAEWVLSDDCEQGDDHKAILRVISPQAVLGCVVDDAKEVQATLQEWLAKCGKDEV